MTNPPEIAKVTGTALGDGLRLAVGTLTALPVPAPRRVDRRVAAAAMLLAPLAALLPGLAATVVCWAADAVDAIGSPGAAGHPSATSAGGMAAGGHLLAAVLAVGAVALTTRGLHLDGLADTADGLAAGYDRERALQVMRRGDTGPAGAATLVLVLLVQVAALAQALDRLGPVAALIGVVAGRAMLPVACIRGLRAARPDGLGAAVAGAVPRTAAAAAVAAIAVVCAALAGWPGPVAVAAAALAAGTLLGRAVQRFGGITGDVLGACVEVSTGAALVVLALTG